MLSAGFLAVNLAFAAAHAELLILLSGTDETFAQVVHARSPYEAGEVEWNARFASHFEPLGTDAAASRSTSAG